jgi:diaminohydroxyphosphoribosylaminopyrimidine deaminase/5-amino-6-(5-phosphoribosylamino)uracil reductase
MSEPLDAQDSVDRKYLLAAIELAERGRFSAAPNPCVGAIIVKDGAVLGRGWHERPGGPHAEAAALNSVRATLGAQGLPVEAVAERLAGATVYVSLEPCAFQGRTPPCADALVAARVARVVGALTDPHSKVGGAGYQRLRDAGIEVRALELPEAEALNPGYLSRIRQQRPFVRLKIASALDGRTAMASGESQWITGPAARKDVQYWRARSDAVLTGSGTVLADDPQLNVRDASYATSGTLRQPLRVVLDTGGRLAAAARIFADPDSALWVHGPDAAPAAGAVPTLASAIDDSPADSGPTSRAAINLPALLAQLGDRGCNEVLVEAGPTLIGAFLAAGLWDEALVYLAPKWLGSSARPQAQLPLERMAQAIEATIADCILIDRDLRLTLKPERPGTPTR